MIIPSQSLEPGPPAGLVPMKIDSVPMEIFIPRYSSCNPDVHFASYYGARITARYSAIAADHDYTLLEGQPLSQLSDTSWYIPSLPAPTIPFVRGQCVLLLSLPSRIFFGCLRSIVRLERSYLVVIVSPEPTAYGPCLPRPCQVFLPISFMTLPRLRRIQHTYLTPLLADDIYERFSAYIPSLEQ